MSDEKRDDNEKINFYCFKCKDNVSVPVGDIRVVMKLMGKGERAFQKAVCPACGCKLNKIRKTEVKDNATSE